MHYYELQMLSLLRRPYEEAMVPIEPDHCMDTGATYARAAPASPASPPPPALPSAGWRPRCPGPSRGARAAAPSTGGEGVAQAPLRPAQCLEPPFIPTLHTHTHTLATQPRPHPQPAGPLEAHSQPPTHNRQLTTACPPARPPAPVTGKGSRGGSTTSAACAFLARGARRRP